MFETDHIVKANIEALPESYLNFYSKFSYNKQIDACFAFNKTHSRERVLQGIYSCAGYADCFNCSFISSIAFYCNWNVNLNKCENLPLNQTFDFFSSYDKCVDSNKQCKSNIFNSKQTIVQGNKYYFTLNPGPDGILQRNQMCLWVLKLDSNIAYSMNIQRMGPKFEEINMNLIGVGQSYFANDTEDLLPTSVGAIVPVTIQSTNQIFIFARNKYLQYNATFSIDLSSPQLVEAKSNIFSVIALVLFILMAIFICVCVICIIRVCMRRRRHVQNLQDLVSQREQEESQTQVSEKRLQTLLEIMKEKPYDKRLDDFKQNECVICLEDFQKGIFVKKVQICHHIFHARCLDNFFKSRKEDPVQKCPLCNCEITAEKIKEARKKNREQRKNKKNTVLPLMTTLENQLNPDLSQTISINTINNTSVNPMVAQSQNAQGGVRSSLAIQNRQGVASFEHGNIVDYNSQGLQQIPNHASRNSVMRQSQVSSLSANQQPQTNANNDANGRIQETRIMDL